MKDKLLGILSPPCFPDDEARTVWARSLNGLLISTFVILSLVGWTSVWLAFENKLISGLIVLISQLVIVTQWAILKKGRLRLVSLMGLSALFGFTTLLVAVSGGPRSLDTQFFIFGTVLAGLYFGIWGAAIYASASLLATLILLLLNASQAALPVLFSFPPLAAWSLLAINLFLVILPLGTTLRSLSAALQQARIDITQRKHIEEQLRASEMRYRNFVEQSIEGIWLLEFPQPISIDLSPEEQVRLIQHTGYITECNDVLARMYGYRSSQELRGKRLIELYGGTPNQVNTASTLKLIHDSYRSANRETVEFTQNGDQVFFINNAVGILKERQLVAIWGTQRDITDLKRTEAALRASEARTRALLEAVPDMIFEMDREGTFLDFVPAQEGSTFLPVEQFLGQAIGKVMPQEVAAQARQAIAETLETGQVVKFEYQLPSGEIMKTFEARFAATSRERVLSIVRDITQQRQAELERERLIKTLEDQNAELERFTYTVSHDLKAPLITIRGFLGFLEKDARENDLERMQVDMERIEGAAEKMQLLLNDLLELSRVGRLINPPQAVPFADILEDALEQVQGIIEARQVEVRIGVDLPVIFGDRTRLVEVLQNLIDNAVKFSAGRPEPCVEIGTSGLSKTGMPVFFVRDNGIGIEPEFHDRIFSLFIKLNPQSEGTGVGLALIKRIIEYHGGSIWVESEGSGKGTAFFFTLPANSEQFHHART